MPVLRRCDCRGCALALACAVVLAVLVDTTNGSAGLPATAGAGAGLAGAGNMGLRGSNKGHALDKDTRRKPYDENKEPGDVILKDWKKKVANPPTALESLLAEMLLKHSSEDRCVRIDV